MSHLRVQVNLERDSGLPEDRVVNVFHFRGLGDFVNPAMVGPTFDKLVAFYAATPAGSASPLGNRLATTLTNTGHSMRAYDMAQPKPRTPIGERFFSIAPAAAGYPGEIALVLSFRGQLLSGTDPSRRRGRVYIGPWAADTSELVGGEVKPLPANVALVANAGAALLAANVDPEPPPPATVVPAGSVWVVHGLAPEVPKPNRDPNARKVLVDVVHLWVDNAWDVQRRRGARANSRVTRP